MLTDRQGPLYAEPVSERRSVSEHSGRLLLSVQRGRLVMAWQELYGARRRRSRRGRQANGHDHNDLADNRENYDHDDHYHDHYYDGHSADDDGGQH